MLVNGDHMHDPALARLRALAGHISRRHAARTRREVSEDWDSWWQAVGEAPELAQLRGERGAQPIQHTTPDSPSADEHVKLLRAAGFSEVGTVWQHGDDRVLVALAAS